MKQFLQSLPQALARMPMNQRRWYRKPWDAKPKTYAREMARRLAQRDKGMIA